MNTRTITIFGAGRIGRGFVADLFDAAGYSLTLIDESRELVSALDQAGRYTVVRAEDETHRHDQAINGYRAVSTSDADALASAIVSTDIAAIAVFPQHFEALARQMTPGLLRRSIERPDDPLDILLCANLSHAAAQFRAHLMATLPAAARGYAETRIGLVETLVMRMVADPPAEIRRRDPLLLWTNGFSEFPVDRNGFRGPSPALASLRLVDNMRAEEARKLYTYNMCHAALAYLGALRGHTMTVGALRDPDVRADAAGALDEVGHALMAEYGFTLAEMEAWNARVLRQTDNPTLGDTVARQGADPRRKLRRSDRLIGPALLARRHHTSIPCLTRAIAAAFYYRDEGDPGALYVQEQIRSAGLRGAIRTVCELNPEEEDLIEEIAAAAEKL
jgi:mannitol-1-phosphate 5-dehydrogenase